MKIRLFQSESEWLNATACYPVQNKREVFKTQEKMTYSSEESDFIDKVL